MAAKRCSRRAADRRVAVAMKMSTGKSKAKAPTARMTLLVATHDSGVVMTVADPVTVPGQPIRVRLATAGKARSLQSAALGRCRAERSIEFINNNYMKT